MRERSAVPWADRLDEPPLLCTAAPTARARRVAGRPVELEVFPGDDHMPSGRAAARNARILDWFREHAAGDGRANAGSLPAAP